MLYKPTAFECPRETVLSATLHHEARNSKSIEVCNAGMEAAVGQPHYETEREQRKDNTLNIRDQSKGKIKGELATSGRLGSTRNPDMVDLAFLRGRPRKMLVS